jgi:hypothetical protein
VSWNGTEYYYSGFSNTTSFIVRNITNSTISVDGVFNIGNDINVRGVLVDNGGNLLAGVNLNVVINGSAYTVTTGADGKWSLNFVPKNVGVFNVIVSWVGDETYFGFSNSTSFVVFKDDLVVNAVVGNGSLGDTVIVRLSLNESINTTSDVIIGNTTYYGVNFLNGEAILNYTISSPYSGDLEVIFVGNNEYNSAVTYVPVVFKDLIGTKISLSSTKNGNKITVKGELKDSKGNILANQVIVLKLGDKSVNLKTNSKGIFNYTFTLSKAGNYYATALYNGLNTSNIKYDSSIGKSNSITINKAKLMVYTKVKSYTVVKKYGKRYRVSYKTYFVKNVGDLEGSKLYNKHFLKKHSLGRYVLSKISKSSNVKTNYNKVKNVLKFTVKNLKPLKTSKIKMKGYRKVLK